MLSVLADADVVNKTNYIRVCVCVCVYVCILNEVSFECRDMIRGKGMIMKDVSSGERDDES
jgi:hypothetical protein